MTLNDIMDFGDTTSPKSISKKKELSYDHTTEKLLKHYYNDCKIIGKKDLIYYADKKTILGNKLKSSDRIISVLNINADGALSNNFISVSPKILAEREIHDVSRTHICLQTDTRREPLIIERQYLENPVYKQQREKIYDQFM